MTATGALLGTPSYMAPEQASGENSSIGPAADIYALGAILYELLCGRPPLKGASALETLHLVKEAEPVSIRMLQPSVPRDLETICFKCLQKSPARRYGTASELADDLLRFLDNRPISARPIGRIERSWRWCSRNRATAGLIAALGLSLLVGCGAVLWFAFAAASSARAAEQALHDKEAAVIRERETARRFLAFLVRNRDLLDRPGKEVIERFLAESPDVSEPDLAEAFGAGVDADQLPMIGD
jgi:hypothetical protein